MIKICQYRLGGNFNFLRLERFMYAKIVAFIVAITGFGIFYKCGQELDRLEKVINEVASTPIEILDKKESYTKFEAQSILEGMEKQGRIYYTYALTTFDTILPTAATLMFGGFLGFALLWHHHKKRWWILGGILLLSYPTLDYWENFRHLEMLEKFPTIFYAGTITSLKWLVIKANAIYIGCHFLNDLLVSGKRWLERRKEV